MKYSCFKVSKDVIGYTYNNLLKNIQISLQTFHAMQAHAQSRGQMLGFQMYAAKHFLWYTISDAGNKIDKSRDKEYFPPISRGRHFHTSYFLLPCRKAPQKHDLEMVRIVLRNKEFRKVVTQQALPLIS